MANIGDLVARLSMDNTGFVAGANQARGIVAGLSSSITAALGPVAAIFAGTFALGSVITGAKEAAMAEAKLTAVLTASGHAAGVTTEQVKAYAAQLQAVTNFEDDATVASAALLASLGNIKGENFERALRLAQDMATVMNTDLDSAVKKMAKNFKDLSPDEVTKKLDEMQVRFGGAAHASADPFKQLQNVLGDVAEAIGAGIVPELNKLAIVAVTVLKPVVEWLGNNADMIQRAAAMSLGLLNVIAQFAPTSDAGTVALSKMMSTFESFDGSALEKTSEIMREVARLKIETATGGDAKAAKRGSFVASGASADELRQFDEAMAAHDKMIAKKEHLKRVQDELNASTREAIAKGFEWNRLVEELDDEIAVLTGTMTKQEAAQRGFLRQGFDDEQASILAAKQAELDAAKEGGAAKPSTGGMPSMREAGVALKGSSQALSAIYAASRTNVPEKHLKIAEQTLAEAKRQTQKLDKLAMAPPSTIGVPI